MTILTVENVNCTDCHRCVRSCPVKAVGIEKGHARLVEEKCVLCGKCVVECPQFAKQTISHVDQVKGYISKGERVIMSLAPSFISSFSEYTPAQLVQGIKALGFSEVEETAHGAEVVAGLYRELFESSRPTVISSCCPVIVNVIEKYYPSLVKLIAPIQSPMAVHGGLIKERYGSDVRVVFAGPCVAKLSEAEKHIEHVDAALSFVQLKEWLQEAGVEMVKDASSQHEAWPRDAVKGARCFPVPGGTLKAFLPWDGMDMDVLAVDGLENCIELFDGLVKGEIAPHFVEALACAGGCVAGPVSGTSGCKTAKRLRVMNFAAASPAVIPAKQKLKTWQRHHEAKPVVVRIPSEAEIRKILRQTNKFCQEDEKNCGACGYNTCRDKAIAVFQGLAEINMCVPHMRAKAELFANIIVDNTLDAVIVVDNKLTIQEFNPAAENMFDRSADDVYGNNLAEIMECASFSEALHSKKKIIGRRVEHPILGLVTEQTVVPVPDHGVVIGIIKNITAREARVREMEYMKLETLGRATEIINKQMNVAQEIAGLLGETAAETKSTLLELIWLIKGKGDA